MSYLNGSYLEDDVPEYDAGNATSALSPALGELGDASEMITLPGGLIMPKKTFYAIIVIIAIIALIIFIRHRRAAAAKESAS